MKSSVLRRGTLSASSNSCGNASEVVKKLAHCALVQRVGGLAQALEGGSLDVMGNLRFQ
jgi:hypothetical protein